MPESRFRAGSHRPESRGANGAERPGMAADCQGDQAGLQTCPRSAGLPPRCGRRPGDRRAAGRPPPSRARAGPHPRPARQLAGRDVLAAAGPGVRGDRQPQGPVQAVEHQRVQAGAAGPRGTGLPRPGPPAWTSSLRAGALDDRTGTSAVFVLTVPRQKQRLSADGDSPRVNRPVTGSRSEPGIALRAREAEAKSRAKRPALRADSPCCRPPVPPPSALSLRPAARRWGRHRPCKSVPACIRGCPLSISGTWPGRSSLLAGHPAMSCTPSTTPPLAAGTATRPGSAPPPDGSARGSPSGSARTGSRCRPAASGRRGSPPGPRRPGRPPGPRRRRTRRGRGLPGAGRPGAGDAADPVAPVQADLTALELFGRN